MEREDRLHCRNARFAPTDPDIRWPGGGSTAMRHPGKTGGLFDGRDAPDGGVSHGQAIVVRRAGDVFHAQPAVRGGEGRSTGCFRAIPEIPA